MCLEPSSDLCRPDHFCLNTQHLHPPDDHVVVPDGHTYHQFVPIVCLSCTNVINVPVYCGSRFCPVCSKPRQSRVRRRLDLIIESITLDRSFTFKHLTLTIPNQPDLESMLNHLTSAFRKLRNRAFWKNNVAGGAFVFEVTGKPGSWHGHLHIIIESRYLKWETLRDLWIRISGGRGVYIQQIPAANVVRYLTKYLSKESLQSQFQAEISSALKGRRLYQPFGSWHSIRTAGVSKEAICRVCDAAGMFELYAVVYGGDFRKLLRLPDS